MDAPGRREATGSKTLREARHNGGDKSLVVKRLQAEVGYTRLILPIFSGHVKHFL